MATPDKSLFKEKTQREKDQEMISGIGAKAAMDAGISKNARAKLDKDSPAIKDAIKRRDLAQKQLDERKAKKDAKKNTVDYSEATKPKKTTPEKKTWKDVKSVAAAKKAGLKHYTGADGKKKLAITKEELGQKKGETLTQAYNRVQGKTPRKQSAASGTKSETPKKKGFRPFGGAIRRVLLGKDEKFGGDKGAIDFIRRKKKEDKKKPTSPASGASRRPGGKAMGGMMKSKMASKGGKMGGKMAPGYQYGGVADKARGMGKGTKKMNTGGMANKKPVPESNKGLKKLPKDVRNKMGYMKNGGMAKKGYSKGGAVKKKSKPRGVGVALRGYGKAMK